MIFSTILELLERYIFFALKLVIPFLIIFILGYYIYKKCLKGKHVIKPTKMIILGIFLIYIIVVLCATFANRMPYKDRQFKH